MEDFYTVHEYFPAHLLMLLLLLLFVIRMINGMKMMLELGLRRRLSTTIDQITTSATWYGNHLHHRHHRHHHHHHHHQTEESLPEGNGPFHDTPAVTFIIIIND